MDIKREDPPGPVRERRMNPEEVEVVATLRADPGHYYRVFERDTPSSASMLAQTIRKGQRAAFKEGVFHATARTVDGKGVVYVKYVG